MRYDFIFSTKKCFDSFNKICTAFLYIRATFKVIAIPFGVIQKLGQLSVESEFRCHLFYDLSGDDIWRIGRFESVSLPRACLKQRGQQTVCGVRGIASSSLLSPTAPYNMSNGVECVVTRHARHVAHSSCSRLLERSATLSVLVEMCHFFFRVQMGSRIGRRIGRSILWLRELTYTEPKKKLRELTGTYHRCKQLL